MVRSRSKPEAVLSFLMPSSVDATCQSRLHHIAGGVSMSSTEAVVDLH